MNNVDLMAEIREAVIVGNASNVEESLQRALEEGISASDLLHDALIAAMDEVGARFERNEFYVPEMLVAARAMKRGMALLRPLLVGTETKAVGKVLLGTVKGDLHDIGKNLVGMMLEGAGFEVIDLGTDVAPERFVSATIGGGDVDIVGMSTLLTTTMRSMRNTIEALEESGLRNKLLVMVGGAPLTQAYAESIGADLYAPDAASASRLARQALQSRK